MNPPYQKFPLGKSLPQQVNLHRGSGVQFKPAIAQAKSAVAAMDFRRPPGPPIQRSQSGPGAVWVKSSRATNMNGSSVGPASRQPKMPQAVQFKKPGLGQSHVAPIQLRTPPVYRPEVKKIVQLNGARATHVLANQVAQTKTTSTPHAGSAVPRPGALIQVGNVIQRARTPGVYAGTFTSNLEIKAILNASEGRKGSTGAVGHPRIHVQSKANTQKLAQNSKNTKTSFINNHQQDQAVLDALNTNTAQAELAKFDAAVAPPNRVQITNVAINNRKAWQSIWNPATQKAAKAKKINANAMTVIVDRVVKSGPALAAGEIHIQTAYPI